MDCAMRFSRVVGSSSGETTLFTVASMPEGALLLIVKAARRSVLQLMTSPHSRKASSPGKNDFGGTAKRILLGRG